MRTWRMTLSIAALVAGAQAQGATAHFYYNRLGATVAELDGEVQRCASQFRGGGTFATTGVGRSPAQASANAAMSGLVVGLLGAIMNGAKQRAYIDECLRIAGWRRIQLTGAESRELERAIGKDRQAALGPIIGADHPSVGTLGPEWQNSYAQPHVVPRKEQ